MLLMGKLTISTGPFSSSQTVSLPEGNVSNISISIHLSVRQRCHLLQQLRVQRRLRGRGLVAPRRAVGEGHSEATAGAARHATRAQGLRAEPRLVSWRKDGR